MFKLSLILFLILEFLKITQGLNLNIVTNSGDKIEKGSLYKKEQTEFVQFICSVNDSSNANYQLEWSKSPSFRNEFDRVLVHNYKKSVVLTIFKLEISDSGHYECILREYNRTQNFWFQITKKVNDNFFECKPGKQIARRYLCDGYADCDMKEDESLEICGEDPCEDKIRNCRDGRCIPKSWCCDPDRDINCTIKERPSCCKPLLSTKININFQDRNRIEQHYLYKSSSMKALLYCLFGTIVFFLFISVCLFILCRIHFYTHALNATNMRLHQHPRSTNGCEVLSSRIPLATDNQGMDSDLEEDVQNQYLIDAIMPVPSWQICRGRNVYRATRSQRNNIQGNGTLRNNRRNSSIYDFYRNLYRNLGFRRRNDINNQIDQMNSTPRYRYPVYNPYMTSPINQNVSIFSFRTQQRYPNMPPSYSELFDNDPPPPYVSMQNLAQQLPAPCHNLPSTQSSTQSSQTVLAKNIKLADELSANVLDKVMAINNVRNEQAKISEHSVQKQSRDLVTKCTPPKVRTSNTDIIVQSTSTDLKKRTKTCRKPSRSSSLPETHGCCRLKTARNNVATKNENLNNKSLLNRSKYYSLVPNMYLDDEISSDEVLDKNNGSEQMQKINDILNGNDFKNKFDETSCLQQIDDNNQTLFRENLQVQSNGNRITNSDENLIGNVLKERCVNDLNENNESNVDIISNGIVLNSSTLLNALDCNGTAPSHLVPDSLDQISENVNKIIMDLDKINQNDVEDNQIVREQKRFENKSQIRKHSLKSFLDSNDNNNVNETSLENVLDRVEVVSSTMEENGNFVDGKNDLKCGGSMVEVNGNKINDNLKLSKSVDYLKNV